MILQIFIGNLDANVTEDELKQICVQFGELIYVKIPIGKGCGFVQYASRYVLYYNKKNRFHPFCEPHRRLRLPMCHGRMVKFTS